MNPTNEPITIAIVDDHDSVRLGVKAGAQEAGYLVVEHADSVQALLAKLKEPPRVVVLDLSLADGSTPATNVKKLIQFGSKVLIYSIADNKDKVNEQRKKYYQTRKESDPAFLEYKRAKAKEYYVKAKLRAQTTITEIPQPDAPVNEVVGVLSAMSHLEGTRVEDIVKPIEDVAVPSETPKPVTKKVLLTQKKKNVEL